MPIRPENRALYPKNWTSEIRPRILQRDENRCKHCGVENYAEGWRDDFGAFHEFECQYDVEIAEKQGRRKVRIVLTIAHLHDPNPANCSDDNLAALCQRCHNLHDQPMRIANRRASRRAAKACGDLLA